MRAALVLLVVMVAALTACDTPANEGPESSSPDALVGRSFVSTDVIVDEEPHQLLRGPLSVTFGDDDTNGVEIAWEAGCNILGGRFDVTADRLEAHLSPDDRPAFDATEMGCEPHEHEQDQWLAGVFAEGPTWALDDDTLVLTTDSAEFILGKGDWRRG